MKYIRLQQLLESKAREYQDVCASEKALISRNFYSGRGERAVSLSGFIFFYPPSRNQQSQGNCWARILPHHPILIASRPPPQSAESSGASCSFRAGLFHQIHAQTFRSAKTFAYPVVCIRRRRIHVNPFDVIPVSPCRTEPARLRVGQQAALLFFHHWTAHVGLLQLLPPR